MADDMDCDPFEVILTAYQEIIGRSQISNWPPKSAGFPSAEQSGSALGSLSGSVTGLAGHAGG